MQSFWRKKKSQNISRVLWAYLSGLVEGVIEYIGKERSTQDQTGNAVRS